MLSRFGYPSLIYVFNQAAMKTFFIAHYGFLFFSSHKGVERLYCPIYIIVVDAVSFTFYKIPSHSWLFPHLIEMPFYSLANEQNIFLFHLASLTLFFWCIVRCVVLVSQRVICRNLLKYFCIFYFWFRCFSNHGKSSPFQKAF